MNEKIVIRGLPVCISMLNRQEYISLTDLARHKNAEYTGQVILHWLSTRYTIEFMGLWEKVNNQDFNVTEFGYIRNASGSNGFVLSVKQWVERTRAIGILSKTGRYNSGTFAHKDIAFEFATWISPEIKFYLIREFQRLKEDEQKRLSLEWNLQRTLAKVNYRIHTDAIKDKLMPQQLTKYQINRIYADEADMLNVALFGITAKEWREANAGKEGNIRDHAALEQLVVLSNLESVNAVLIHQGLLQAQRLEQLNRIAIMQMRSLLGSKEIKKLR